MSTTTRPNRGAIVPARAAPLAVSLDETCRLLGIGQTKLLEEINAGRLKAVKVGARTLLPTKQFPGWLKSLPRRRSQGDMNDPKIG